MTYSREEIREMIWASFEAGMFSQQLRTPEHPEPEWEYSAWMIDADGKLRKKRDDIGEEYVAWYRERGLVIRRRHRAGPWGPVE